MDTAERGRRTYISRSLRGEYCSEFAPPQWTRQRGVDARASVVRSEVSTVPSSLLPSGHGREGSTHVHQSFAPRLVLFRVRSYPVDTAERGRRTYISRSLRGEYRSEFTPPQWTRQRGVGVRTSVVRTNVSTVPSSILPSGHGREGSAYVHQSFAPRLVLFRVRSSPVDTAERGRRTYISRSLRGEYCSEFTPPQWTRQRGVDAHTSVVRSEVSTVPSSLLPSVHCREGSTHVH